MRGQEARDQAERKAAMATLAQSTGDDIVRLWNEFGLPSDAEFLRGPETGLVTVRGRIGGGGAPFNVGEATVTRATVRLHPGRSAIAMRSAATGRRQSWPPSPTRSGRTLPAAPRSRPG